MSEASTTHQWFSSTAGVSVTSHNGSAIRPRQLGTRTAFVRAYRAGYRWFQVDATPIKDDLVSHHAIFGRTRRLAGRSKDELAHSLPDVPCLYDLLTDPELPRANWNIEMKSRTGLPALLRLLTRLGDEGWDLSRILVSSPMRPSVLEAVVARFPQVAVAAPVIHGGTFGIRFLGPSRARAGRGRPYDCQQVYHPFVRARRRWGRAERPLVQAWTVGNRRVLDRVLRAGAHPIVDSQVLMIRRSLGQAALPVTTSEDLVREVAAQLYQAPDALALGGGGWRGAFGGIGAVMYFTHRGMYRAIHDVVGISGGSFAVAALARQPSRADRTHHGPGHGAAGDRAMESPEADDDGHVGALRQLLEALEGAGSQTRSILGIVAAALVVLATVGGLVTVGVVRNSANAVWVLALLSALVAGSFLVRAAATMRWKWILRGVYGTHTMAPTPPDDEPGRPGRRFAIGATGLSDGYLYSFTSSPDDDVPRWRQDPRLATPLGGHRLADVVARATSLPGIGQLGVGRVWLPTCDHGHHTRRDRHRCDSIPDRLVDGGVSGIFGRGLIQARYRQAEGTGEPTEVVVVDAGRRLPPETRSLSARLARLGQRSSALILLSRWLQVAMDVAYREELKYVRDGNVVDGHRFRLVRLAEEEDPFDPLTGTVKNASMASVRRRDDLNRLYVLRDQVHQFSLMRVNRVNANRTIVVAVAACALEFEHEPDIGSMLAAIGERLGRGRALAEVWHGVRVPLLGEPAQLGPPEVRGPEAVDHRPAAFEVSIGGS